MSEALSDRIQNFEARSVQDFLELVNKELKECTLFRGQRVQRWGLEPSLVRSYQSNQVGPDLQSFERLLVKGFRLAAPPHVGALNVASDWEWLALAQHHHLPTRLLDWSTNPLVGLFFAVDQEPCEDAEGSAVWAYSPPEEVFRYRGEPYYIDQIKVYEPPHISARITAQYSRFTVHPDHREDRASLDIFESEYDYKHLSRVIIPAGDRGRLREELVRLGFHAASLFPGLDGVAIHVTRSIGVES